MTFITPAPQIAAGTIVPYGGGSAPSGYLLCDGSAISRTTYAGLFAVIAELYGVGDGSTTFNVPDLQGNVPVGIGASGVTARGDTGGAQTHTHAFTVNKNYRVSYDSNFVGTSSFNASGVSATLPNTDAESAMQPYVGTEYIIKT